MFWGYKLKCVRIQRAHTKRLNAAVPRRRPCKLNRTVPKCGASRCLRSGSSEMSRYDGFDLSGFHGSFIAVLRISWWSNTGKKRDIGPGKVVLRYNSVGDLSRAKLLTFCCKFCYSLDSLEESLSIAALKKLCHYFTTRKILTHEFFKKRKYSAIRCFHNFRSAKCRALKGARILTTSARNMQKAK